jgi:hypothetical protein
MFSNGGVPMELDHPTDREETSSDRIAAMMPEPPKKGDDGYLVCCADLIDTPMGRIAYQLAKYGFNLGISSRGTGDVITDMNGDEVVDESTYDFKCFDLVLLPAVKNARLKLMTESLGGKTLKQALNEELDKANDDERQVMVETLQHIRIEPTHEKVDTIDVAQDKGAADNDGVAIVKELQESLRKNKEYEKKLKTLQEGLSVCYTKEHELQEELQRANRLLKTMQQTANKSDALNAQVAELSEQISKQKQQLDAQQVKINSLQENLRAQRENKRKIDESYSKKSDQVKELSNRINTLQESLETSKKESKETENKLNEQIEDLKKDSLIKNSEYSSKLSNAKKLAEKYQRIARIAVDKYIGVQAIRLGVNASEIKNRLSENYSFDDIDKACDDLSRYKRNISTLPFELRENIQKGSVKVTKSKEPIMNNEWVDDDVDTWLLSQANGQGR